MLTVQKGRLIGAWYLSIKKEGKLEEACRKREVKGPKTWPKCTFYG